MGYLAAVIVLRHRIRILFIIIRVMSVLLFFGITLLCTCLKPKAKMSYIKLLVNMLCKSRANLVVSQGQTGDLAPD